MPDKVSEKVSDEHVRGLFAVAEMRPPCEASIGVASICRELLELRGHVRKTRGGDQTAQDVHDAADLFWDDQDPESAHESAREILFNYQHGVIAEIQCATRLPNLFAFTWPQANSDDDDTYIFFTEEEAKARLETLGPLPGEGGKS